MESYKVDKFKLNGFKKAKKILDNKYQLKKYLTIAN
jgi:hypothetical protein